MLNIKALSHVGSDKKIIENSILKSIFDPVTYLWNQLEWFKKSLVQEQRQTFINIGRGPLDGVIC